MSTQTIIGGLIAIMIAIGVGFLLFGNKSSDTMMEGDSMSTTTDTMMKDETGDAMMKDESTDTMMKDEGDTMMKDEGAMMESKGTYEAYSADKLALAQSGKVVLFFHAPWCPVCVPLDKAFSAGGIPAGVHILKVDYDTATDLKKKYGVTYQHTFVQVDAQGKLITKFGDALAAADVFAKLK